MTAFPIFICMVIGAVAASAFWLIREVRLRRQYEAKLFNYRRAFTQLATHHVELRAIAVAQANRPAHDAGDWWKFAK